MGSTAYSFASPPDDAARRLLWLGQPQDRIQSCAWYFTRAESTPGPATIERATMIGACGSLTDAERRVVVNRALQLLNELATAPTDPPDGWEPIVRGLRHP